MAKQGERTRDLVTGVLSLALLAAAAIGAWTLFQDGPSATDGPVVALDQDASDGETAEQIGGPEDASENDEPELRISVHLPSTLAVDRARPVLVDVTTPDGRPLAGDARLTLRATVAPADGLRGYLSVVPGRATATTARDLRMSKLEVAVTGGAPCDRPAGTLTVHVMELGGEGRQATREVELPDVACTPSLPGATDAVHMTDPVCGAEDPDEGDHAAELRAILDGEDQESTWCMSDEKARELGILEEEPEDEPQDEPAPAAREPEDEEPEDDEDEDEEEEDDADEDDADDDGNGGNGNGDDSNGGNGDSDDGNGDNGGNGNGDNGGNGNGDNGGNGNGDNGGNGDSDDGNGNGGNGDGEDGNDGNGNGGSNGNDD